MTDLHVYHVPIMLNEVLEDLAVKPDGIYVDGTAGGGGHSSHRGGGGHSGGGHGGGSR